MKTTLSVRYIGLLLSMGSVLLLAGCTFFPGPAATATPQPPPQATATLPPEPAPTDTPPAVVDTAPPPASDTPAPTSTNTVEPNATSSPIGIENTATATVPATPDPNEAVGDIVYQDPLDGSGGWFWTFSDDVSNFGVDTTRGQLKAVMSQTGSGWRFTISPDTLTLSNQQVRLTAQTETCSPNDEYGLMFRGQLAPAADGSGDEFSMYLFKLSCGGSAAFQRVQGSDTTTLVDWTASPAIQPGAGVTNQLMVWMAGSEFRFYANDQHLFSAQDTTLTSGFFGIYLYDRTAGGETVYFEGLVSRAVNR
jgi:hypothetical protein